MIPLLLLAGALSASVSDDLRKYEGLRLTAYRDTQGFWTCGWGHRCAEGTKMNLLAAEKALADDISSAEQLGESGMRKFVKFGRAIAARDYATASREMLNSRWHKQTPKLCEELARKINQ
jgi:hypothetical protein